ncbi:hypothetical protein D3C71_1908440 [compost metagenome]
MGGNSFSPTLAAIPGFSISAFWVLTRALTAAATRSGDFSMNLSEAAIDANV